MSEVATNCGHDARTALAARVRELEYELASLHDSIRTAFEQCPGLPLEADRPQSLEAATDCLHSLCLIVGIHDIRVPAYADGPGVEDGPWAAGWAERNGKAAIDTLTRREGGG
jgi:hypothetical protein